METALFDMTHQYERHILLNQLIGVKVVHISLWYVAFKERALVKMMKATPLHKSIG